MAIYVRVAVAAVVSTISARGVGSSQLEWHTYALQIPRCNHVHASDCDRVDSHQMENMESLRTQRT